MAECRTLAALFHPGGFCSSPGSFATLAAIRRASSLVSSLAADDHPLGVSLIRLPFAPVCRMDLDRPPCATVEPKTVATLTGECEFVHTDSICHTEEQIAVVWD
jgi:hypothetical protein